MGVNGRYGNEHWGAGEAAIAAAAAALPMAMESVDFFTLCSHPLLVIAYRS
ncbi:hypothetical protein M569_09675 [Genlisea aurea]|uniref:Uncharacterized protein n=1 Tax=Genlisea aurea TaxID=192259 RepID=S8CE17_9LAMI|nr:hypothetical protein M569_09675 [Genlisea aurea]